MEKPEKLKLLLMNGVHEDCERLLIRYEKMGTVRFNDFCEIWKEMKFATIYGNKQLQELDVFVPEILLLVKNCFVKSTSFNLKVGALYMLYALYYKQPLKCYKKILITHQDWLSVKEFIKEVREFKHYDTLLIIFKLISDNAFIWSALDRVRGDLNPQLNSQHSLFDINLLIDDVELDNDIQDLKEIEEQYTLAKQIACERTSNEAYREVVNFSSNIADELSRIIKDEDVEEEEPKIEAGPSIDKEADNIGKRRKSLRSKCFRGKVSPTKTKQNIAFKKYN